MNDITIITAFSGLAVAIVTTAGAVFVAFMNNRKERTGAAEHSLEATLRERILLRDEQIAHRDKVIGQKDMVIAQLEQEKLDLEQKNLMLLEHREPKELSEGRSDNA